jgi:hypothetical protein
VTLPEVDPREIIHGDVIMPEVVIPSRPTVVVDNTTPAEESVDKSRGDLYNHLFGGMAEGDDDDDDYGSELDDMQLLLIWVSDDNMDPNVQPIFERFVVPTDSKIPEIGDREGIYALVSVSLWKTQYYSIYGLVTPALKTANKNKGKATYGTDPDEDPAY